MYPPSQTHYTYQFTPSTSNSFFGPKSSKNSQITNCQKLPEVTQDFLKDKKPLRERFVERLGKLSNVLSGIANVLLESAVNTLTLLGGGLFMLVVFATMP